MSLEGWICGEWEEILSYSTSRDRRRPSACLAKERELWRESNWGYNGGVCVQGALNLEVRIWGMSEGSRVTSTFKR